MSADPYDEVFGPPRRKLELVPLEAKVMRRPGWVLPVVFCVIFAAVASAGLIAMGKAAAGHTGWKATAAPEFTVLVSRQLVRMNVTATNEGSDASGFNYCEVWAFGKPGQRIGAELVYGPGQTVQPGKSSTFPVTFGVGKGHSVTEVTAFSVTCW